MTYTPFIKSCFMIILFCYLAPGHAVVAVNQETEKQETNNYETNKSSESTNSIESQLARVINMDDDNQSFKALSLVETIFINNKDHILTRIYYGRLLVKNGDGDKAISVLQPLAKQSMNDWRLWFWLGTAQLINGELDNAAFSLDEALAREGDVVSLWVQRAIVEQERGNADTAVHLLQIADNIEPGNSDVMVNYAYASELSGDINKAIIIYKHFLQITSSNPRYGRLRSQILFRLSQFSHISNKPDIQEVHEKVDL